VDFSPDFGTKSSPKIYYCIEFAVHDYQRKNTNVEQVSSRTVVLLVCFPVNLSRLGNE
jgi:hypothetical protein